MIVDGTEATQEMAKQVKASIQSALATDDEATIDPSSIDSYSCCILAMH